VTATPSSVLQGSGTSSLAIAVTATGVTPSGTVEAWDGATKLGEGTLAEGTASITVGPFAAAGQRSIEVRYLGDAQVATATGSVTVTVTAPVTTTTSGTAADMTYGTSGSVVVTVTPATAPGGVEVLDGATSLGTATLTDGTATVPLAAKSLEVGTHTLTVRYLGATGYATSSGTVDLTVLKAAPAVTATGSSVQTGDPATVAVTVTADGFTPTGTVEAWFNNNRVGQATLASGAATIPVGSFASAGAKSIEVRYLGDGHAAAATGATTVTVTDRPLTQTSVTGSAPTVVFGKAGSATITVMPAAATGTVELLDGATSLGTGSLSSGSATIALAAKSLSVGMHTLVARYAGNATYAASQGSFVVTVTKATPTVTATATPTTVKVKKDTTSVAVAVKADGVVPTGTVDVLVDGVVAATGTLVDGKATVVVGPFDAVGSRSLAVRYDGDASVAGATSGAVTVTVQKQQPRLTIGKPAGVRAGHVARIVVRVGTDGYAPHGKVRLQGHGLKARTVRVRAGKAVFGVRLDAGRHRLKAVFLGDGLSVKVVRTFHVRAR
jgi:5'-nucleotidase